MIRHSQVEFAKTFANLPARTWNPPCECRTTQMATTIDYQYHSQSPLFSQKLDLLSFAHYEIMNDPLLTHATEVIHPV